MRRPWAFRRRFYYASGVGVFILLLGVLAYFQFFHNEPTCSDGVQNGDERGVDCGGSCSRVCSFDTAAPAVLWAKAFPVTDSSYNAVAYVENRNMDVGTPELAYRFTFYDASGAVIGTRDGTSVLPPDSVYPLFEGRINTGGTRIARTFVDLMPVDNWQETAAGRERFAVRSRTLAGADSDPRLSATLYNTSLDDVRDVEIVATIFDARGNALTASQTLVPLFSGRDERTVTFTWPEPIASTVRSCEVPSDVLLAIDLSGSMNNDGGTPPEPIHSVQEAARAFVDELRSRDQAGVVTYATDVSLAERLSQDHTRTDAAIAGLSIDPAEEQGRTNIGDAIKTARAELRSSRHNENARKVLILLTDGKANAPGDTPEEYATQMAAAARDDGIIIYTIGLGETVEDEFLQALAGDEAHYFRAPDRAALDQIYRTLSTSLCEDGAAVIDIVPKHYEAAVQ